MKPIIAFCLLLVTQIVFAQKHIVNALKHVPSPVATTIYETAKEFPPNTQFSIAKIEKGKAIFWGVLRSGDSLVDIRNEDSVFEIGSITKVFTGILLATYVEKGAIKLSDPINTFFDFPFKAKEPITFVSLANHTSGLPRLPTNFAAFAPNPYQAYDTAKLNYYLKNEMVISTDKNYAYSNLGAGLLGYTLFRLTKQTPQGLVEKDILSPLLMKNTYTSLYAIKKGLVSGLNPTGQPAVNWDFDILFGGGGILSSASDLSLFAMAQFDATKKAFQLSHQPTITVNENLKVGLGWHIIKVGNRDIWWHSGGTAGYTSSMAIDLEKESAIVILSNVSGFHSKNELADKLCFTLLQEIK